MTATASAQKLLPVDEDKQPKVFVIDDVPPEDLAMLQALYSRSPASVVTHLDKVRQAGSSKFMSQYYVGYGHASIGDCGFTTVFIENFSMLAAKAIQDNQLYNGQEASTRYLDFSTQPLIDPYQHPESQKILEQWMHIYNEWMPIVKERVALQRPFNPQEYKSEKVWMNAVTARAFDVMRGFLPVGTSTLLSWTTNLRQARDRLMALKVHPLQEIRDLATIIFQQLHQHYPNSFNGEELSINGRYAARDTYAEKHATKEHYQTFSSLIERYDLTAAEQQAIHDGQIITRTDLIAIEQINKQESESLASRPENAGLPRYLNSYGQYHLIFTMDFGSYRDLQRHRGGHCPLPLIDNSFGFSKWYLGELEKLLTAPEFAQLNHAIQNQFDAIDALASRGVKVDPLKNQYLYPMGMLIPVTLAYGLPQMVYVSELRALKTVHGSLRPIAQNMSTILKHYHPSIKLYTDMDAEDWTAKRGEQTITAKS